MSVLGRKLQEEEKMKNHFNKLIAAILILAIVGFLFCYFVPTVGYPILAFSILMWMIFDSQLYKNYSKCKIFLRCGWCGVILSIFCWVACLSTMGSIDVLSRCSLFAFAILVYCAATIPFSSIGTIQIFYDNQKVQGIVYTT